MYKGKILKNSDAALYCMPSLEEEKTVGSDKIILQKTEEIQRKAYEEGFSTGEKAGFAAGEQKADILLERLNTILDEIIMFKEKLVTEMETQVVDLAVAIARKIIIKEMNTRPEVIITIVKEALKKLQKVGTVTIKLNPALYDLFVEKKPELIDIHQYIRFDINSNVPIAGPVVISETEEVVTDIEVLMMNIIEEMERKSPEPGAVQGSPEPDVVQETQSKVKNEIT